MFLIMVPRLNTNDEPLQLQVLISVTLSLWAGSAPFESLTIRSMRWSP
jgi:hypothetical protein